MNRYRTTLRPAPFGGVPSGVRWSYVEGPHGWPNGPVLDGIPVSRHRYGVIETDRPLTKAEMGHFDIVEV